MSAISFEAVAAAYLLLFVAIMGVLELAKRRQSRTDAAEEAGT